MPKQDKFVVISKSTLKLKEIRYFKAKLVGTGVLLGMLTVGVIVFINHFADDLFGLSSDRISKLTTENRILKERLGALTGEVGMIARTVGKLAEQGDELRLLVDLKRIDADTRLAGVGGSVADPSYPYLGDDAAEILATSQEVIGRLSREVKLQQASYEEVKRRYDYNTKFFKHLPAIKPMKGYYTVNDFGMRVHPVLRVYRMHEGVDIANDAGTDIYATGDGVVRFAGRTQGGYGTAIDITHGFGYSTSYAHLSKIFVRPGQTVKRGELIAKSGRTGLVSGPHLHYEVRWNGRKQNPVDYFFDDVDAARYRMLLAASK